MATFMRGGAILTWGQPEATSPVAFQAIYEAATISGLNYIVLNPYNQYYSNNDWSGAAIGHNGFYSYPMVQPAAANPEYYSDAALIAQIQYAHSLGLKVFMKPMIDPIESDSSPGGLARSWLDPGVVQVNTLSGFSGASNVTATFSSALPATVLPGAATLITGTHISASTYLSAIASNGLTATLSSGASSTVASGNYDIVISADSITRFFAAYTAYITHYATIAQEYGVELFSVGCELSACLNGSGSNNAYVSNWTSTVIPAVRAVYSGPLTYSGYINDAANSAFWGALDYTGVDYYNSPWGPWPDGTYTGTATSGSATLTSTSISPVPVAGDSISDGGNNIPANTTVASTTSNTVVMSANAIGSGSTTFTLGTTRVSAIQANIKSTIVSSGNLQAWALQTGRPLIVTETTACNAQGSCENLFPNPSNGGPSEQEQAAVFQALIQELESGSYSWYAGIQMWCWYHINDPIHWCQWRKYSDRAVLRNLWHHNNPQQTTLFALDPSVPPAQGVVPRRIVTISSSYIGTSPFTGLAVTGSYWASPGDVVNVTTGASTITVYLPSIAYKNSAVTVTKVDSGGGSITVEAAWLSWATSGNFDNGPSGHCLVNGSNSQSITTQNLPYTYTSNGSDFNQITIPSLATAGGSATFSFASSPTTVLAFS
jgi:hypothetical protein